jgi:response regulator RpfG family c-di-GMP phosphodiesterase
MYSKITPLNSDASVLRSPVYSMNTISDKTQFISVVDDELDIMTLFRDALSQLQDVEVFGFTNSPLSLEHFKMNQSQYSLVLSDFRIPEMDGIQLLKEIKAIKPSVKTLLVSTFEVENELLQQCSCIDTFLQKPVSMIDLIEEVEVQLPNNH